MGDRKPVVGDADMPDFSLRLRLKHRLVETGAVAGFWAERRVMELVNIDVIGAQVAQRGFQILSELSTVFGSGFAGDKNLAADSLQRLAQLNLAVGIGPGGVKVSDSALIGHADQAHGLLLRNALNRKRAEPVLINGNSCFSQCYLEHVFFLLSIIPPCGFCTYHGAEDRPPRLQAVRILRAGAVFRRLKGPALRRRGG